MLQPKVLRLNLTSVKLGHVQKSGLLRAWRPEFFNFKCIWFAMELDTHVLSLEFRLRSSHIKVRSTFKVTTKLMVKTCQRPSAVMEVSSSLSNFVSMIIFVIFLIKDVMGLFKVMIHVHKIYYIFLCACISRAKVQNLLT